MPKGGTCPGARTVGHSWGQEGSQISENGECGVEIPLFWVHVFDKRLVSETLQIENPQHLPPPNHLNHDLFLGHEELRHLGPKELLLRVGGPERPGLEGLGGEGIEEEEEPYISHLKELLPGQSAFF